MITCKKDGSITGELGRVLPLAKGRVGILKIPFRYIDSTPLDRIWDESFRHIGKLILKRGVWTVAKFRGLMTVQNGVSVDRMREYLESYKTLRSKGGRPVMVAVINNTPIIIDGNHRACLVWLMGENAIKVKGLNIGDFKLDEYKQIVRANRRILDIPL